MPKIFYCTIPFQAALRRWGRRTLTLFVLMAGLALALDRAAQEAVLKFAHDQYGAPAAGRVKGWFTLMQLAGQVGEKEKLKLVNDYFNRIPNISDEAHWASADYWATPLELIGTLGGDCEDFALAKYFTLRELGVPDERLRLTYVRAYLSVTREMQRHMVLTYHPAPQADPLVLDNLVNTISTAAERKDLAPTYSFNGAKLWAAKQRGNGRIGETEPANLWELLRAQIPLNVLAPETPAGR